MPTCTPESSDCAVAEALPPKLAHRSESRLLTWLLLVAALALFVGLACGIAATKAPWCDEGWFANAAYNLAFKGYMGSNIQEPSGHFLNVYLKGIREHTYVVVPYDLVSLSGWYRLFGFSLFTTRTHSILWGSVALLSLFVLVLTASGDRMVALLATALCSLDVTFLWGAADGRVDMMCVAFLMASYAAYFALRRKNFTAAFLAAHSLAAISCMSHANGGLAVIGLALLTWRLDRARFERRLLWLAAIPYSVALLTWAPYILQSPSDWLVQFPANAAGRGSSRWKMVIQPWYGLWYEMFTRYLAHFGLFPIWIPKISPATALIPLVWWAALLRLTLSRKHEWMQPYKPLLVLALYHAAALTFLIGFKAQIYLTYVVPFYNVCLAIWAAFWWRRDRGSRIVPAVVLTVLVALNVATAVENIRADAYHKEFLPTVAYLRENVTPNRSVIAPTTLGFGLGFEGFTDDLRLGMYTGQRPDFIVLDRWSPIFFRMFMREEHLTFRHVWQLLQSDYQLVFERGSYRVFRRYLSVLPKPPARPVPNLIFKESERDADLIRNVLVGIRHTG